MTARYPQFAENKRRQPSKAAKRRVLEAFDADKLAHICTTWDFSEYAQRYNLQDGMRGRERFFYYQDNGSDILAIAHLDSVQDDGTATIVDTAAGKLVVSGTLDDRLGAYVILELLPKLGIVCDVLLTTDEEIGASTAEDFFPEDFFPEGEAKQYNWMFQFDRGGTDVVMYQYETEALVDLVEESGARVGSGSFSDICMLEHLACVGFNWGVGYEDYHGARSHAWLDDTFRMVARFVKFHKANAKTWLYHDQYRGHQPFEVNTDSYLVADCGDEIDLDDESTYIECSDGKLVCVECGTMPLACLWDAAVERDVS